MIKIAFDALWKLSAARGIDRTVWQKYDKRGKEYVSAFRKARPGYLRIINDSKTVKDVKRYAASVKGQFDDVVVLGIGGSAMGAICLDTALRPLFSDRRKAGWPRLTVLDNIDPDLILDFEKTLNLKKTLFLVISKSGDTVETLSQFLYFQGKMAKKVSEWRKHFVIVTDASNGLLRNLSGKMDNDKSNNILTFSVPSDVGGRFSVFSVVGLLPAALAGIKIDDLMKGAKAAERRVYRGTLASNPAYALAVAQFLLSEKKRPMQVFYIYSQKLRYLGDWYRQLLAESIGKKKNRKGKKVYRGLTPITSLGVTDQHSQNQLYLDGPDDKVFIFLGVDRLFQDAKIAIDKEWASGVPDYFKNLNFSKLLNAERQATVEALSGMKRPVISISMERLDAKNLGELMVIMEASVSLLGDLLELNVYDQPGVELSKKLTGKYLK